MQGNRSKDTGPELRVRKALWAAGVRGYRKNVRKLPGCPDLVFGRERLVIFVHGCYWHRCPHCSRNLNPKTRADYWSAKFDRNVERDAEATAELEALGYRVEVVWECEVAKGLAGVVERILGLRRAKSEAGRP
jgi:DNA mismatch endonuclease (patch repair protein)